MRYERDLDLYIMAWEDCPYWWGQIVGILALESFDISPSKIPGFAATRAVLTWSHFGYIYL